jgi:hypothetical protein
MKTQILDTDIIINGKRYSILNTEMDIVIDWDAELTKTDEIISLEIKLKHIKGTISFSSQNTGYKKKTSIDFSSDSSWVFVSKNETINIGRIEPVYSLINLDEKVVTIEY